MENNFEKENLIPEDKVEEAVETDVSSDVEENETIAAQIGASDADSEIEEASVAEEVLPEQPVHNPGGMIRSAITAVIVLVLFVCIYFGYNFFAKNNETTQDEPSPSPSTLVPAEIGEKTEPEAADSAEAIDSIDLGELISKPTENSSVPLVLQYTRDEAMEIAKKAAKAQFGADAVVFPASDENYQFVEINGSSRMCYMFGADSVSKLSAGGTVDGLYHVDANTGEVFDNQDGLMVKIEY